VISSEEVLGSGTWAVDNKVDKAVGKELAVVAIEQGKALEPYGIKVSKVVEVQL
jgi:hypothetical protein